MAHAQWLIYMQERWPRDTAGTMMATALTEVGRGGMGKEVHRAGQEGRSMGGMWRAMVRLVAVAMARAAVATASTEDTWAG